MKFNMFYDLYFLTAYYLYSIFYFLHLFYYQNELSRHFDSYFKYCGIVFQLHCIGSCFFFFHEGI